MEREAIYKKATAYFGGALPCYEKGVAYLKQAADLGHAKAQYNLGICLHEGRGTAQCYNQAFHYFQLAANQDHPRANYMIACYYVFGFLFPPSEERAMHYFRLAAEAGLAEAQYNLAVILLAEKKAEEAVHYFKLAAAQDHVDAQYNLGICYCQGLGCNFSHDESIRYLELAFKQKHPRAAKALEYVMMGAYRKD